MAFTMTNEQCNIELKNIVSKWARRYDEIADESFNQAVRTAKAGTYIPPKGQIIGEAYKEKFDSESYTLRDRAQTIVDDRIAFLKGNMAGAPTDEQINTISLLNLRSNVSKEELETLAAAYSVNYQAYMALVDVAEKHKVYLEPHSWKKKLDSLELLRQQLGKLSRYGMGEGYQRRIIVVCLNDYIDDAFPVS